MIGWLAGWLVCYLFISLAHPSPLQDEAKARRLEEEETQAEGVDPEMAALMGFGGFGAKKR